MSNIKLVKKMIKEAINENKTYQYILKYIDKREAIPLNKIYKYILKYIDEKEVIPLNITYKDLEKDGWTKEKSFHGDDLELLTRYGRPCLVGVNKTNDTYEIATHVNDFGGIEEFIEFFKNYVINK